MNNPQTMAFLVNRWCWRCGGMRQSVRYFYSSKPRSKVTIPEPFNWRAYQCRFCGSYVAGVFDPLVYQRLRLKTSVTQEDGKVQIVIQP